jgi:hypothetical protein
MGFSLTRVAPFALPDAAFTSMSWDTELEDTTNTFTPDAVTATTINIPADGVWAITSAVQVAVAATGINMISLSVSGITVLPRTPFADVIATLGITLTLAAGTPIQIQVYRDGAAATTMTGFFQMWRTALI